MHKPIHGTLNFIHKNVVKWVYTSLPCLFTSLTLNYNDIYVYLFTSLSANYNNINIYLFTSLKSELNKISIFLFTSYKLQSRNIYELWKELVTLNWAMFKFYWMSLMSNSWNKICNYLVYKKIMVRIILGKIIIQRKINK